MTLSLEMSKIVPGTPDRVFDAWTQREALLAWWGPPGGRCTDAQIDLRVGGEYALANEMASGDIVWIRGTFSVIERPRLLVYTWHVHESTEEQVTVRFEECPDGTKVTVLHERIPNEDALRGHTAGWDSCLDGLARLLR